MNKNVIEDGKDFQKPDFDQYEQSNDTKSSQQELNYQKPTVMKSNNSTLSKFSQNNIAKNNSQLPNKSKFYQQPALKASNFQITEDPNQKNINTLNEKLNYLEEEVEILNERLRKSLQKIDVNENLDEDDAVDLQILKRKNSSLKQQNEYLKKIQQQLTKTNEIEKKKWQQKNQLLNRLVSQYEMYTKKLKSSLDQEKEKMKNSMNFIEQLQVKVKEYDNKLKMFESKYVELKKKNQILTSSKLQEILPKEIEVKTVQQTITPNPSITYNQAKHTIKVLEANKINKNLTASMALINTNPNKPQQMKHSLNLYQAFYQQLNKNQNKNEQKKSQKNYEFQKNLNDYQKSLQLQNQEVEDQLENESIKNLIMNDEMMKMFSEEEEEIVHTKDILQSLKKIPEINQKKGYDKLKSFSLYQSPKFGLLIKASSLFENSILFQNDFLTIQCQTTKKINNYEMELVIELQYQPKIEGCYLTTNFEKPRSVEIFTQFNKKLLIKEESQFLVWKGNQTEILDFAQLDLTINFNQGNFISFKIPVPLTINKFCQTVPITQEVIDYFFKDDYAQIKKEFQWNSEIIDDFFQLTEIFSDIYAATDDCMLLHIEFPSGIQILLELQQISEQKMEVTIHCPYQTEIVAHMMDWFYWIFSLNNKDQIYQINYVEFSFFRVF